MDDLSKKQAYKKFAYRGLDITKLISLTPDEVAQNLRTRQWVSIVDIDKMRKLLPYTMNIEKHHLKRLVHSNMHVLNQAMAKMKNSKSNFLQFQVANKIISTVQKLDKDIDSDIFRIQLKKNVEEKRKGKKKFDIKSQYDSTSEKKPNNNLMLTSSKESLHYMKQYDKLITNMKSNVIEIMNAKKQYFDMLASARSSNSFDAKSIKSSREESPFVQKRTETGIWFNKKLNINS